jgi:hypothetical protein
MDSDCTALVLNGTERYSVENSAANSVYSDENAQEGLLEPSGIPIPTLRQKINPRAF